MSSTYKTSSLVIKRIAIGTLLITLQRAQISCLYLTSEYKGIFMCISLPGNTGQVL